LGRDSFALIKAAVTFDGAVVFPFDDKAFGYGLQAAFGQPEQPRPVQQRVEAGQRLRFGQIDGRSVHLSPGFGLGWVQCPRREGLRRGSRKPGFA